MNLYLAVLKKYAVFDGRARRKEFWYFGLANAIVWAGLSFIDGVPFGFVPTGSHPLDFNSQDVAGFVSTYSMPLGQLSSIYLLATLLPVLAATVRRLHDIARSGWWFFVLFIPVIGPIILLVFLVQDSQSGENQYGPNPKTGT